MAAPAGSETGSAQGIPRQGRIFSATMLAILVSTGPVMAEGPSVLPGGQLPDAFIHTTGSLGSASAGTRAQISRLPVSKSAQNTASPRIRGLVVPKRQANISAAIAATIKFIGPDNGDRFQKGDTLVEFDCGIYDAELNRANAVAEAAADTLGVKSRLAASGSISRLQATLAGAELKKSRAEVVVAKARAAHCRVPAPFSGRVVRRIANAFETVAPRDPLIEIVDDTEIEIRVFVPSFWLRWLRTGGRFSFDVDETGARLEARIIALGASIDNVSQLVELRAVVEAAKQMPQPRPPAALHRQPGDTHRPATTGLLAGMSGNAIFPKPPLGGEHSLVQRPRPMHERY